MLPAIGFIGLGTMGSGMARNLLKAGYPLIACDIDEAKRKAMAAAGAVEADSASDAVRHADYVMTSLPNSEAFVAVAEASLLPGAREGQVFIDLGTTVAAETRRIAHALAEKGAALLDVPVSGGGKGAAAGTLRMFAGGDEAVFDRCRAVLEVLGDPRHIVYCGPSGSGQVVKGVNQLMMGLTSAALLEALGFGVLAGVDIDVLRRAVGGREGLRADLSRIAKRVAAGEARNVGVKFGQLAYFLDEAAEKGFKLPLSRALHEFCEPGQRIVVEVNRPSPSFWHELNQHEKG
jgi:3-hydroxyisobutyrate dehydrogenase-like beta-hydroxyacid dehydrogenase